MTERFWADLVSDAWLLENREKVASSNDVARLIRTSFGIEVSSASVSYRLRTLGRKRRQRLRVDLEWLREQYVDKQRSSPDIARELGAHHSQVLLLLRSNGWGRTRGEWHAMSSEQRHEARVSRLKDGTASVEGLAWCAGFFDGEGCVSMRRKETTAQLKLALSNASEEAVRTLAGSIGGGVVSRTDPRQSSYLVMWIWHLTGWHDVRAALRALLPYLVVKRQEVSLALDFLDGHTPLTPYTAEDWERFRLWRDHVVAIGGTRRAPRLRHDDANHGAGDRERVAVGGALG